MTSPPQNQANTSGVVNTGDAAAIQTGSGTQNVYINTTPQPPPLQAGTIPGSTSGRAS